MSSNKISINFLFFLAIFFIIILVQSCASIQQPDGGPKDSIPPKILSELPKNYTTNFRGNKIIIEFDEYFKLNNEYTEISISPYQEIPPIFRIKQKKLDIELKDTLEANTTYTINFGKGITDVNENNELKNYTYVFSTGNVIDSLQISGKVINSSDNKIVPEATVFIFPVERDTLFGKRRPALFTVTDTSGNFSLKNLKEDSYRIYALKEDGGDRIFNSPNEEIGFSTKDILLNKDTSGIILKLFKEIPEKFRVTERRIEKDGRLTFIFNKGIEKPSLRILEPNISNPIISYSPKADTVLMWVKDLTFDSIKVQVNTDATPLDTITIKRNKRDTYTQNILYSTNLSGNKLRPNTPLTLTFNVPIANLNKSKISLLQDSVPLKNFTIENINNDSRTFKVTHPWKVKKIYTLQFNEEAVTDIFGTTNKALKTDLELDEVENYGNLTIDIAKQDSTKNYIVQLLNEETNIIKETVVKTNSKINYPLIPNGKYLIKVIEDINKNGIFDTGNVKRREQPEKSWFFEKEIIIRPNWDREEKVTIPLEFP